MEAPTLGITTAEARLLLELLEDWAVRNEVTCVYLLEGGEEDPEFCWYAEGLPFDFRDYNELGTLHVESGTEAMQTAQSCRKLQAKIRQAHGFG